MRPSHIAWIALGLFSCGEQQAWFLAPPSPPEAARSILVLELEGERIRSAKIYRLDESWSLRRSSGEVLVAYYPFSPEWIGVDSGTVDLDSFAGDCGLLEPLAIFRNRLDPDPQWSQEPELGERLREPLGGAGPCFGCIEYRTQSVSLGSSLDRVRFSLPLPSGAAVIDFNVGTSTEPQWRLVRVSRDRADLFEGCSGSQYVAGASFGPNRAWLGRSGASLDLVELDEENLRCTVVTSTRVPTRSDGTNSWPWKVAAGEPDAPLEVYFGLSDGSFFRYDGERFEIIGKLELNPDDAAEEPAASYRLSIVRLGPDDVFFANENKEYGHWTRADGFERLEAELTQYATKTGHGHDRVTSLAMVPGLGLLAGGPNGEVYRIDEAPRGVSLGAVVPDEVEAIHPRGRGFVALVTGGRVVQFHEGGAYCPPETIVEVPGSANEPGRASFLVGHDVFVGDFVRSGEALRAVWLSP